MRVCLVSQEYPPETASGGIGTQTWNKARCLAKLGHDVHVLTSTPKGGAAVKIQDDYGITIYRIEPPGAEFSVYEPSTYWFGYTWFVLRQLNRLMREIKFDIIDVAEYGAEGFAYQLDRTPWNWVPVVVQLHGPLAMLGKRIGWPDQQSDLYKVGTFMEEFSIRKADALMACSANIADFTAEFYSIPRESINIVHCGVDKESFRPSEQESLSGERPTVLFVGNIAKNKGIDIVLEAVLRLRHKYPQILLKILGNKSDAPTSNLRMRIREQGAEACIEFCGFVDRMKMPEYYQRAYLFASPAQHECGVANVYIEAMACGCPVVASTSGGASEVVVDGESGFLVPPNDIEATAKAFDKILSSESIRSKMGLAGRKRVNDYFAMDRYIERVLSVYELAIERNRLRISSQGVTP